jgi:hypothetical protein
MAIDATAGGASADSYADVATADAYHETRLYSSEWDNASTPDKEAALKWATRLLDQHSWVGYKATISQALRWPRSGVLNQDNESIDSDVIPQWLKNAVAEFALELLKANRPADPDTAGFKKIKVDIIELEVDSFDRSDVVPRSVMAMIEPYIAAAGPKLVRV